MLRNSRFEKRVSFSLEKILPYYHAFKKTMPDLVQTVNPFRIQDVGTGCYKIGCYNVRFKLEVNHHPEGAITVKFPPPLGLSQCLFPRGKK